MTKFKIEIQITILTIVIVAVVATIGYFSNKILTRIVYTIHQETLPDNKLFLIKDIANELITIENTTRLYILSNNVEDLLNYQSHQRHIILSLKKLNVLRGKYNPEAALIDSIGKLSNEKLELWQKVLEMNLSVKKSSSTFSEIYKKLDEKQTDTLMSETEKTRFYPKIFDQKKMVTDTSLIQHSTEKDVIKQKLKRLEKEMAKKRTQKNILESQLLARNIIIGKKINQLITEAENKQNNDLLEKTNEADRLAAVTYKWLTLFTFCAVLLLLIALFIGFNYLKKTRIYQRALTEARKKAETLARAKEEFAANVSHELRTPVNAIYGLTEQVLQKPLEKETSEMVSVIFKSATHLKNIINDTLDFSKIQANKIKFKTLHFSPLELFDEVFSLQKYEAEKKGISMNFDWEGERPGDLVGDPLRLKQILINLISNAIKFTEKGEVAVKVKSSKTIDQHYELEIKITDTGIGIKENDLPVIFDEFVQIENQTGKKYSGTGLGLSIVKKLVDSQGGKINIKSKPGEGTQVTIILRYTEGKPVNIRKTVEETILIPETFKELSVLVADDEEYNRFLIKSILQKWGIKFKEAKNGNEVISATHKEKFDIILMDINMPEMNGIEASKAISKYDSNVIVIAITADNAQIDKQAYIKAGMKGFILKPFSEKDLFDTFVSVIPANKDKIPANLSQQINMNELLHLANDDKKFLGEMILLFIKSAETGITNMEEAIKNKNLKSVFENAHKMAAPTKHLGATHLYNKIKQLEKMAQEDGPVESIHTVFQEIKNEVAELNAFLKSHQNKID